MVNKDSLFFRLWLTAPFRIAALQPSSKELCATVAAHVDTSLPGSIIELGSGTGVIAMALLARGVAPERLYLVELTPEFCEVLRTKFPRTNVLEGDVNEQLARLAAAPDLGPVSAVISSLPIVWFAFEKQRAIVRLCFELMGDVGRFLQVSYLPISPLPHKQLGLRGFKIARVWRNALPATVWRYEQA